MTIGVIYCAWESQDYIHQSLSPWIKARAAKTGGHDYVICAVCVPFVGFELPPRLDYTYDKLRIHLEAGDIDHLISGPTPMTETDARGVALRGLVEAGVTHSWICDSDEFYELDQIANIARVVDSNPFVAFWKLSLKNYVFDTRTYLLQPFTPARIHAVKLGVFTACGFWDDNNVLYFDGQDKQMKDTQWASFVVPPNLAFIKHYSWISNDRSRKKVAYQVGRGWECSFAWDEARGEVTFNESYYNKRGLPLPDLGHDEG